MTATRRSQLSTVEDYRRHVLVGVTPVADEAVALGDAHGRVLSRDVTSRLDHPAFTNAAMDGYALRASDASEACPDRPAELAVVGESAAGSPPPPALVAGTALRIMTGAPVPAGADSVVPVEVTTERDGRVRIAHRPASGDHVRRVGEELRSGARIATRGSRITATVIGLLAASGVTTVWCHRRARVIVLSTGDELVRVGGRVAEGQLHDSNGPMLVARVTEVGALAENRGPIVDDPDRLRDAVVDAAAAADLVVVTGGVSAGRYDHLPQVLRRLGPTRRAKVAMRPGKPQVHAIVDGRTVLGLPGNPVSAFVSFELFGLPVLRTLQGRRDRTQPVVWAAAGARLSGSPGHQAFVRVRLEATGTGIVARPTDGQRSHMLGGLAAADGLAEVLPDHAVLEPGEPVRVHLLTEAW